jgi:hypothetical protein
LKALRVETVADRLRAEAPSATIVSLSLKERAALLGGGRRPSSALWIDLGVGRFATSSAVASAFPDWARAIVGPEFLRPLLDKPWTCLDREFCSRAATPDEQVGEGDLGGYGIVFPHLLGRSTDPAAAFRASPLADDVLLSLALAGLKNAPADQPVFLVLSLSANDYIGHIFGPDSWEAWDELRRLDAALGGFFAELDRRYGANGWSAVLTSDHGGTTLPEAGMQASSRPWCRPGAAPDRWERGCGPAFRLVEDDLRDELKTAAVAAMGTGDWIEGVAEPYVFLGPDARRLDQVRRGVLMRALKKPLASNPAIDRVFDVRTMPSACPPAADESVDALICRSIAPQTRGDLYLLARRGSFFDANYVTGSGSSHGAPYLYDRAVPLFVRAPGRMRAGQVVRSPVAVPAFARLLATLLGIEPPAAARDAPDLTLR